MRQEIQIHYEYNARAHSNEVPLSLQQFLTDRRKKINENDLTEDQVWQARTYPVLAILAPVMSTSAGKIEFPGDPMCLYSALSYAVDQVVRTRQSGSRSGSPYNDLCPNWGILPSPEYRARVEAHGIRQYDGDSLNTDQTIFDPRIWNEDVREYFIQRVLLVLRPKVILISAVSPAHRYAIDIARTIRTTLPDCLIILGGRHTDETHHYDPTARRVTLGASGTIARILDGSIEPVFDFVLAGDGYHALDLLMKVISLSMDIQTKTVRKADVLANLSSLAPLFGPLPGNALLLAAGDDAVHAWPIGSGIKLNLAALPSPYAAFAIRAHFPIFQHEGRVLRTAHFMVTNSCTYHCYFCSEGVTVVGRFLSFRSHEIQRALERVVEYVSYGTEALFFDDSIFWGGNFASIVAFSRGLSEMRTKAQTAASKTVTLFGREVDAERLANLQWGAQFTVDLLASRPHPEESRLALQEMKHAGCCYIYVGIESMAAEVIERVHKNISRSRAWEDRVRVALGVAHEAGIAVGSSVLFGLDGETDTTITETISKVEELLAEDLLSIASPNILTYHPNTEITAQHGMQDKLDYHSPNMENRPPYVYFEEAFPAVVSRNLTEEQIWLIHEQATKLWGTKRNTNPMPELVLEEEPLDS